MYNVTYTSRGIAVHVKAPANPVVGQLAYNPRDGYIHIYDGNTWNKISGPYADKKESWILSMPTTTMFKNLTLRKLWWKYVPGSWIKMPWPEGKVEVDESSRLWDETIGTVRQEVYSADPNDHYRPWLEANIGRQGWDWDWEMESDKTNPQEIIDPTTWDSKEAAFILKIKARRCYREKLAEFKLIFG